MTKGHAKTLGIFLLKLAGTVLFLWWAFSRIEDKSTLSENFYRALRSPFWVCFGLSMALFSLLANAFRWQFLLRAQQINQPFGYIFRLTLYGAFFNIVSLGGAAGDAAKIVLLIRREPEKKVGVAMSVMVDHVIGFIRWQHHLPGVHLGLRHHRPCQRGGGAGHLRRGDLVSGRGLGRHRAFRDLLHAGHAVLRPAQTPAHHEQPVGG